MEKPRINWNTLTVNWYHYQLAGKYCIDMEFINHVTGMTTRKTYSNTDRKKVNAIAQSQETRYINNFYRNNCMQ